MPKSHRIQTQAAWFLNLSSEEGKAEGTWLETGSAGGGWWFCLILNSSSSDRGETESSRAGKCTGLGYEGRGASRMTPSGVWGWVQLQTCSLSFLDKSVDQRKKLRQGSQFGGHQRRSGEWRRSPGKGVWMWNAERWGETHGSYQHLKGRWNKRYPDGDKTLAERDFPDGPVLRLLALSAGGPRSSLGQGTRCHN